MMNRSTQTLADLSVGESGVVEAVSGDDSTSQRLLEMGVTPGVRATMVGIAPMGDPIEFTIRNYRLSLRKEEAGRVVIGKS